MNLENWGSNNNHPVALIGAKENDEIDRYMMAWINSFPDIPSRIERIDYESLAADKPGMALSTIQGAYFTRRFITGGYQAEYQFKILYRIKAGLQDNDKRLSADELLNSIGDWALTQRPYIGDNLNVISIEPITRSSLFAIYDNNDEDHQILLKMTYERVI